MVMYGMIRGSKQHFLNIEKYRDQGIKGMCFKDLAPYLKKFIFLESNRHFLTFCDSF